MTSSTVAYFILMCWGGGRVPICVSELEACLEQGTKETQVFVEVYSLGY
jgi:hypothetical protein